MLLVQECQALFRVCGRGEMITACAKYFMIEFLQSKISSAVQMYSSLFKRMSKKYKLS